MCLYVFVLFVIYNTCKIRSENIKYVFYETLLRVGVKYWNKQWGKYLCEKQKKEPLSSFLGMISWDLNDGNFALAILTPVCSNTLPSTGVSAPRVGTLSGITTLGLPKEKTGANSWRRDSSRVTALQ